MEKNTVSEKSYDGAYTGCEVWAFPPPRIEIFTNSNKRSLLEVSGKQILKWQFICRNLLGKDLRINTYIGNEGSRTRQREKWS